MTGRPAAALATAALLLLATGSGCSKARLQEIPGLDPPEIDNLMAVTGQYCTQPPEETVFPVKILFVLDQSTSLQCTDPQNKRFQALNSLVQAQLPQPNVFFGFVGFSSWTRQQTFTRELSEMGKFLDAGEAGEGPATDYQGALATARALLEEDMLAAGPAETVRTRYVVVVVSDGQPEPRCVAGCEDSISNCADGVDNDADGLLDGSDPSCVGVEDASTHPDSLYGLCNWTGDIDPETYVDFAGGCPAYNQPEQILQRVQQIMDLEYTYAAGDLTMHAVLLFAPDEVVEAQCPGATTGFGYSKQAAETMLQAIASAGGGTYRDVDLTLAEDDFLEFDYESLFNAQWLTELVVTNAHARWVDGVSLDTDTDGLPDDLEALVGTETLADDSDHPAGDGFSDLFEYRLSASGFDPTDPALPAVPCMAPEDTDGDGLLDCEEAVLGTDDRGPDSDGDGLIDWLEVAVGTDPLVDDALWDLDFDGVANRDEVRGGTDPVVADGDAYLTDRIRYELADLGPMEVPDPESYQLEERHCYDFSVHDVQLVTPLTAADRGLNRLLLHTLEEPFQLGDVPARGHVACVEVFYEEGESKRPESGVVDLGEQFWLAAEIALDTQLIAVRQCLEPLPADPEVDPLDGFTRDQVLDLVELCLPKKVEVGEHLLPRDDLVDLTKQYLTKKLVPKFPLVAAHVFVPIEVFDPALDCVRPYELERLEAFLSVVAETCQTCALPEPEGEPELVE